MCGLEVELVQWDDVVGGAVLFDFVQNNSFCDFRHGVMQADDAVVLWEFGIISRFGDSDDSCQPPKSWEVAKYENVVNYIGECSERLWRKVF